MTKISDKRITPSAPPKSEKGGCSSAVLKKTTAEIKRLMTTALDGGKLMGDILNDQFIENNPILAMMYTFTYIYYSAQVGEIRRKTDGFTEKYRAVCKLSAKGLLKENPPVYEKDNKSHGKSSGKSGGKKGGQGAAFDGQGSSDGQNALAAALADYGEIVGLFLKHRDPALPHSLRKRREIAPLTDS